MKQGQWQCVMVMVALFGLIGISGCGGGPENEVVIYTSQDQVYSEPILKQFEEETGINVRPTYDSEAVKTVGLAKRLLQERSNPRCDVFWNNEEFRTRKLAAEGVFRKTNGWSQFGYRTRRIVINTNLISREKAPTTFQSLTNSVWEGKLAMAYPLFGTTATHFLALREVWGKEKWLKWCRALRENDPMVVDGNSVVVKMVGMGEVPIGFTDSDDIAAGQDKGYPIKSMPLAEDSLLIHNTVGLVRGGPNPKNAEALADYLQSDQVVKRLLEANAIEGTKEVEGVIRSKEVDWEHLLTMLEESTKYLKKIFVRK